MAFKIGAIYKVRLVDGHGFAAKLTEIEGETLTFENRAGYCTTTFLGDIRMYKEVV